MVATIVRWVVRVVAAAVIFGALGVGLSMVWHDGPVWWAVICTPVFVFVGMGAAVWMADNL